MKRLAPRKNTARRTEPGRADADAARHGILDAAERLFASAGFAATSMREISQAAGVAQSLLHYHFGNKEKLFQVMFERRARQMNDLRLARLAALLEKGSPPLESLLEVLLRPTVELGRDDRPNPTTYFSRLMLLTALSPEAFSKDLVAAHFDPFARRMIGALRDALPGLSPPDAVWGYLFAIGVAMTVMAPTGRANRLSDDRCDDSDTEALLAHVIAFAAAGLRQLATGRTPPPKKRPSGR